MDLRFVAPDLRFLDGTSVELCACTIWNDERPLRGFAGLLDWRLAGRLSALLRSGFMRGDREEALLIAGKPHVPFEKVLVLGLGAHDEFGEGPFREALRHMSSVIDGLRVRRAVVELPGRGTGAIDPETAIALTLECIGALPEHDTWWLVEGTADQKRTELRAANERRRAAPDEDELDPRHADARARQRFR